MASMIKEKFKALMLLNIKMSFFSFLWKTEKIQILKKLSREHPEAKTFHMVMST